MQRNFTWCSEEIYPDKNLQHFHRNTEHNVILPDPLQPVDPNKHAVSKLSAQTLEILSRIFLHLYLPWQRSSTVLLITQTNRKHLWHAQALSEHQHSPVDSALIHNRVHTRGLDGAKPCHPRRLETSVSEAPRGWWQRDDDNGAFFFFF